MSKAYEKLMSCVKSVREKTDFQPEVAVILGSGLGGFADGIQIEKVIPYGEIEGFPTSTVEGHKGQFVFGYVKNVPVVIMQGRVHYYEGYSMEEVVLPTRLMGMLGAKKLVITNATGGLNETFPENTLMIIKDQISVAVPNPLIGENLSELGERFPDMSEIYSARMRKIMKECAERLQIPVEEGVYVQLSGPSFESPAEIRMVKSWGADAVGMSTTCEAIAAKHMGMEICGISWVGFLAAGLGDREMSHDDVQAGGLAIEERFSALVTEIVCHI